MNYLRFLEKPSLVLFLLCMGVWQNSYAQLEVSYVQNTEDACNTGAGEGAVSLSPTGGTGPYSYNWANAASGATPTGLQTGLTSVEVTDATVTQRTMGQKTIPVIIGSTVNWTSLEKVSSSQGQLFAVGFTNFTNAGAISTTGMGANTDGGITYRHTTSSRYMIGLSAQNTDPSWTSLGYSIYTEGSTLFMYRGTTIVSSVQDLADQDRISIIRVGSEVIYYKNGNEMHRETVDASVNLYADVTLASGQTPVIYASWCTTADLGLTYTLTTPDDCATGGGEGTVGLQGNGGNSPYTYTWTGGNTDNPRTGLSSGLYNVTLASGASNLVSPVIVGGLATWGDLTGNATQNSGTITATTPTDWTTPEGGLSTTRLAASTDGGITFVVPVLTQGSNFQIGLSSITATDANWENIGYSVWVNAQNTVRIYESGVDRGATQSVTAGDRVSIIRRAGSVEYYVNSTLLRTAGGGTVTQELAADISIIDGTSPTVYTSWCTTDLGLTYTLTTADDCTTAGAGEGEVTLQGTGAGPYTYEWGDANTDNPRTGLSRGLYEVTVTSGASSFLSPVIVGAFVNWADLASNTTQTNGTVTSTVSSDWTTSPRGGFSTNRLAASTNGGISFVITDLAQTYNYQIGLSSITATETNWQTIGYSVWIGNDNIIKFFESGTNQGGTEVVTTGDKISIIRRDGNIEYYLNSKLIRTVGGGTITQELAADVAIIAGTSPVVYASFCNPGFRVANKVQANETTTENGLEEDTFSVYPNPSTGLFNVRFATQLTADTQVSVFDGIGRKINTQTFEKGSQKCTIELNNQPKGVYLSHFNQNGVTYSKSVIID